MDLIDRNSPTPLYAQLKQLIYSNIQKGVWMTGDMIPTEVELCETYEVSRITALRALNDIAKEGYVKRISGKGTYVTQPKRINQALKQLTSFTDDMKQRGKEPGSRVISMYNFTADQDLAKKFGIDSGERLTVLKRLRLMDNEPLAIETAFLPGRYFPDIDRSNMNNRSLYDLMKQKYDQIPTRATQRITATLCPVSEADLLRISKRDAVLRLFRTTFNQNDQVIEIVESFYRGDAYIFQAELTLGQ